MEITYVYQNTESGLYTVGYYNPTGKWVPESDHDSSEAAAARVHYLNGGDCDKNVPEMLQALGYAADLIKIARNYFPKSVSNRDRFNLENTNAAITKALKGGR